MREDSRNTLLFVILSAIIIFAYPRFFGPNPSAQEVVKTQNTAPVLSAKNPVVTLSTPEKARVVNKIKIAASNLSGKILSQGALFDDVSLNNYTEKNSDQKIDKIHVLKNKEDLFFAFSGWSSENQQVSTPDLYTYWDTEDLRDLSPEHPLVFSWNSPEGIVFEKKIEIDDKYLITITDSVINNSEQNIALRPYTMIRKSFEDTSNSSPSYEGPLGYFNGKVKEVPYGDISSKGEFKYHSVGGWSGITDKYWLATFLSEKDVNLDIIFSHSIKDRKNIVTISSFEEIQSIAPMTRADIKHRLFVGAKEIKTLDAYEESLGVTHFDLAIDFGYLYFLTKPLLYALVYIKDLVGNMGLSILILTLLIKLILWPLANKSYRSMNKMKDIQPKIEALRKRYSSDQMKLGQEITALYKKEGINPIGGCLPMFLQLPVLIALYKVLYISIEMRHAPFIGWITDLSSPDPFSVLNLGGLIPISLPGFLSIGIWPILMGLSMFFQQKMTPTQMADPAQEKVMLLMPIIFTFMFSQLPAGLVIYWTFSNVLAMIQQITSRRQEPRKA